MQASQDSTLLSTTPSLSQSDALSVNDVATQEASPSHETRSEGNALPAIASESGHTEAVEGGMRRIDGTQTEETDSTFDSTINMQHMEPSTKSEETLSHQDLRSNKEMEDDTSELYLARPDGIASSDESTNETDPSLLPSSDRHANEPQDDTEVGDSHHNLQPTPATDLDHGASILSPILEDPTTPLSPHVESPAIEATSKDQSQFDQWTENQEQDHAQAGWATEDSMRNAIHSPDDDFDAYQSETLGPDLSWHDHTALDEEQQRPFQPVEESMDNIVDQTFLEPMPAPVNLQPVEADPAPKHADVSFFDEPAMTSAYNDGEIEQRSTADANFPSIADQGMDARTQFEHNASPTSGKAEEVPFFDNLGSKNDGFEHEYLNSALENLDSSHAEGAQQGWADTTLADSWEQAFANPESGLDDTWDAAFGGGLDDDGFLGETDSQLLQETQMSVTEQSPTARQVPPPVQPSIPTRYAAPLPAQTPTIDDAKPIAPMKFFEELPIAQPVKARRPKQQTISQGQPQPAAPPQAPVGPRPPLRESSMGAPRQISGLRGPERLDPFPPQPSVPVPFPQAPHASSLLASQPLELQQSSQPPPPSISNDARYSPSLSRSGPPAGNRYSPAPQANAPNSTRYSKPASPAVARYAASPSQGVVTSTGTPPISRPPYTTTLGHTNADPMNQSTDLPPHLANKFAPRIPSPLSRPPNQGAHDRSSSGPSQQDLSKAPDFSNEGSILSQMDANVASRRYSPTMSDQRQAIPNSISDNAMQYQRQPSIHLQQIPPPFPESTKGYSPEVPRNLGAQIQMPFERKSIASREPDLIDFVMPSDSTASDPLERWKGRPIITWGLGGILVTSFSKHVPRYGGGQAAPKMKPMPGEIKLQRTKDIVPGLERVAAFPGPLKSKTKKKEVGVWLTSQIEYWKQNSQTTQDLATDEHIILLEALKLLIEQDGVLGVSTALETFVRTVLSPGIDYSGPIVRPSSTGITTPATQPSSSRSMVVQELRQHLLRGEREKAIWHAVDNKLWAHAMLISSTVQPETWKQVIREFVHKDVRSAGDDSQSVATLYEVFAGNWDECVEELVPVSARAGLQMMSTTDLHGQPRNTLDGLNKWRETLGLILSNRSKDDERAIATLGKLLASYGRTDAAHVCFVFARSAAQFAGMDDPQSDFSLLGSSKASGQGNADVESILLTEIYEFSLSLPSSTSTMFQIPHLQSFKLHHARVLAEMGNRHEAMQYCEVVGGAVKSNTNRSPYYHPVFLAQLDETMKLASQSPKDASSSWMGKPNVGKVSSSMWRRLEGFIAGDEGENGSVGSGNLSENEAGPFAKAPGSTPDLSRPSSRTDQMNSLTMLNSKYAPVAMGQEKPYSPYSTSPERLSQGAPAQKAYESVSPSYGSPTYSSPYLRYPQPTARQTPDQVGSSTYQSYQPQVDPPAESYVRQVLDPHLPSEPSGYSNSDQPSTYSNAYAPHLAGDEMQNETDISQSSFQSSNGYIPTPSNFVGDSSGYEPGMVGDSNQGASDSSYEPLGSVFEPPSGGYVPSSYEPGIASADVPDPPEAKPKRRNFMEDDDDDELIKRAAALKDNAPRPSSTSSSRDTLDPAVRAALEAQRKPFISD